LIALEDLSLETIAGATPRSSPRISFTFSPDVPWTTRVDDWVSFARDAGRAPVVHRDHQSVTWPVRLVPDPRPLARILFLPDSVALEALLAVALGRTATEGALRSNDPDT
jgi:hypothetical protein